MKHLITVFAIFTAHLVASQFVLKGSVNDGDGNPLPGVKVYIDSTTYGVITDYNGLYFLELKEPDLYPIHYKMLGMTDTVLQINISDKLTVVDVVLTEESTQLESVEIVTKKIKVANSIIKKGSKKQKEHGLASRELHL